MAPEEERPTTMEVLTSYPHHQLGAILNPDVASHCHFGVDLSKTYGNDTSLNQATPFPQLSANSGTALLPGHGEGSEDDLKEIHCKEEKDSDAGEACISSSRSKGSKKDST